jgi:hypothetical protein
MEDGERSEEVGEGRNENENENEGLKKNQVEAVCHPDRGGGIFNRLLKLILLTE